MAMHIAKTADVHEDVKPECRASTEGAKGFVVLASMAQAKFNDL